MVACFLTGFFFQCTDTFHPSNHPYAFRRPQNFPEPTYTFENNALTTAGVELGRALFYDPILSADSTIACASCHQQASSFSDPVHKLSRGVNDASGFRNAPAIQNMAFQNNFFWDGGITHLDFVPINAITSDLELGEKLENVVAKLARHNDYRVRFKRAFGTTDIDSQKVLHALSQFMSLMISADSRYDRYVRNEGEEFTNDEREGLKLFTAKCTTCHATDIFSDGSFRNNGLSSTFEKDAGRERVTEFPADRGKFKVPGLRNVELTFPYMHDGRFRTLEDVLNHYAHFVKDSETLDPALKESASPGIGMTTAEKAKIIAFLKTLTDRNFTTDRRFSNPFNNQSK